MGRVRNHQTWCEQTLGSTCFRRENQDNTVKLFPKRSKPTDRLPAPTLTMLSTVCWCVIGMFAYPQHATDVRKLYDSARNLDNNTAKCISYSTIVCWSYLELGAVCICCILLSTPVPSLQTIMFRSRPSSSAFNMHHYI